MLISTPTGHQTNLFGNDLIQQLDPEDPLLQLAQALPWAEFETAFSKHYTQGTGRPSKPIRLMVGLLLLKQLENLSDEKVVLQFKRNPYYQALQLICKHLLPSEKRAYSPFVNALKR